MGMQMGGMGNVDNLILQELPDARKQRQRRVQGQAKQNTEITTSVPAGNSELPNKLPHIKKTVTDLERISLAFNKKFKFKVDHKSKEVTVKVIDPETDKVIKELPPKELDRLRDHIRETIGILFDAQF
ncbi:MAG: flagellar protein FlaG [Treponema sp.]|jgi:flagellar protein FlaG|nr:flagellar protein FlaG [Treponema sp.]